MAKCTQSIEIPSLIALIHEGYIVPYHLVESGLVGHYKVTLSIEKTSLIDQRRQKTGRRSQLDLAVRNSATQATENVCIMLELRGNLTDYFELLLVL